MALSSFQAAKTLCDISGWSLTNLKLQKLLYLAHMVYLGRNKKPMITEPFSAWMYGPVLPSLYDRVKIFGTDFIGDRFYNETLLDKEDSFFKTLQEIYNFFGKRDSWELVRLTHSPQGAWSKNYDTSYNKVIPDEDILAEYNNKVQE